MQIGKSIKYLRIKKEILQKDFAELAEMSPTHLSQIEHGHKKPSLASLESMAIAFDIPLPVLLWFSVEESDVKESNKESFRALKTTIDSMIGQVFLKE